MATCYHGQELHPSTAPNLKLLIKRCKQRIKERKIKVLFVGAGASGVALSSILAFACKQHRGFVRKEGEVNNHMSGVTHFGDKSKVDEIWFVDDLISTGDTLNRVRKFFEVDVVCTLLQVFSIDTSNKKYKGLRFIHGEEVVFQCTTLIKPVATKSLTPTMESTSTSMLGTVLSVKGFS